MNEIFNTPDVDWPQLRPVLDDAMQELAEPDREAVLLRYFERRAFAEIGRTLHVTEDAARMRVDRALEKLRTLLARRGVSSTAAALATVLGSQVAAAPAGLVTAISGAVAASAITSAATTTTTFMTSFNIITGTLALAAIGTAVLFSHQASQRAAELAVSQQERAALQARLDGVESRFAQAGREAKALQDQLAARRVTSNPAPIEAKANPPGMTLAAGLSAPLPDEHEKKMSAETRQREIARALAGYDPLFQKLGLAPAQVDQFRALLTANLTRHFDLREFARVDGVRPSDPDVGALDRQAEADLAAQIRANFGDATVAAFQHFNDTGAMRELTGQLTIALAATITPLSPSQADQLVEILANNSRTPEGHISGDPRALNFEAAFVQAQALLSPVQLAALRQAYADRRE
jgi:hypothetical protein